MSKKKQREGGNAFLIDDGPLPLPARLQAVVDNAPRGSMDELDAYVIAALVKIFPDDPLSKERALSVYQEREEMFSLERLSDVRFNHAGFLGAELRVLRARMTKEKRDDEE